MKVFAILGEGSNQRALANRIHETVPLCRIARIMPPPQGKRRKFIRSMTSLTLARSLRSAWQAMLRHYDELFPDWPDVPLSFHPSANAPDLVERIIEAGPDLILVSGTDLLRSSTLERLPARVMNLHTGISPYIKGGPNCTNWALALGDFDLIGNTVMWIDEGIDSGAIITTERTPLTGHESLAELHIRVMDHAHGLYRRAVERFARGQSLPAVPQGELDAGRLFFNRHWNSAAMLRAAFNHRFRYRPFSRRDIRLVAMEAGEPRANQP